MEVIFTEVFEAFRTLFVDIIKIIWKGASKLLFFLLWALLALIILPCVFVAAHIYPIWMEWGEEF